MEIVQPVAVRRGQAVRAAALALGAAALLLLFLALGLALGRHPRRPLLTAYLAALTIAEDDERRSLATSVAKSAAGDCAAFLAREGIQIHGGIGYTWEHDLHLWLKRARAGDSLLGTAAWHRARIADLLGLPAAAS